jgi:hypothetical protein
LNVKQPGCMEFLFFCRRKINSGNSCGARLGGHR